MDHHLTNPHPTSDFYTSLYSRPRHSQHSPAPLSAPPMYSSAPNTSVKPEDVSAWYTASDNLLRSELFTQHPTSAVPCSRHPSHAHNMTITSPSCQPHVLGEVNIEPRSDKHSRLVNNHASSGVKLNRKPELPAEKDSAMEAARIAEECEDNGPESAERFKCSFEGCDKAFQRRYNLKVHVRKHTNETPYKCSVIGCAKKFKWRSSMSHHLNAHKKRILEASLRAMDSSKAGAPGILTQGDSPHGNSPHGNSPHGNSPHGNSPHGNSPQGDSSQGDSSQVAPLQSAAGVSTALSGYRMMAEYPSISKAEDKLRRVAGGRMLPTSPISTGNCERLNAFGIDNLGFGGAMAMEDLGFQGDHVGGDMMFDHLMHNSLMDASGSSQG